MKNLAIIILTAIANLIIINANATVFETKGSGQWSKKQNWENNNIPEVTQPGDTIIIHTNHNIIVQNVYILSDQVTIIINGTLDIKNKGTLNIGSDSNILVNDSGSFKIKGTLAGKDNNYFEINGSMSLENKSAVDLGSGVSIFITGTLDFHNNANWNVSDGFVQTCGGVVNNQQVLQNMTMTDCDSPMPVELLSFDANTDAQNNVKINWSTATETNSDYFTVEKSFDGTNWEIIGFVTSAGNSNQQIDYTFTDNNAQEGVSYYRLKQTDFDGKFEYFAAVAVEVASISNFEIYTVKNIGSNVFIQANFQTNGQVIVADQIGNIVFNHIFTNKANNVQFNVKDNTRIILVKYADAGSKQTTNTKYLIN